MDSGLGGAPTPAEHRGFDPTTYIRYPDEIDYGSDRNSDRADGKGGGRAVKQGGPAAYPLWCVALYDYTVSPCLLA